MTTTRLRRSPLTRLVAGLAVGVLATTLATTAAGAEESATGTEANSNHAADPVIWTTETMLGRARARIATKQEPFHTAWEKTLERAQNVLDDDLVPYQGPDPQRYFIDGRDQAKFARDVAIAFRMTRDRRFLFKAREILLDWARDAIEYPYPDPPKGFHAWPASDLPHGSGLRIGRVIPIFADAYAMIWEHLTPDDRRLVDEWLRLMVDPLLETQRIWQEDTYNGLEPPWLGDRNYVNHLIAHMQGLAAVGFATQDPEIIENAISGAENPRDLQTLIDGVILMPGDDLFKNDPTYLDDMPEPLPGEVYDRYRTYANRGMLYSLISLRFLMLIAEMTHNNQGRDYYDGLDYYDYVGPGGENLELTYQVYSPWWITGQASAVNPPYYSHEQDNPGFGRVDEEISSWEVGALRYPDNDKIIHALESWERVTFDPETWGYTAPLTHGPALGD